MSHCPTLHVSPVVAICALLVVSAAPLVAQRTVVQDAGAGKKLELHYNAANQIVEQDTMGANGELIQKETIDYSPAAYIPQTTTTYYWPDGKVHRITQDTYDNNANFTGEFIQVFDETGKKQVSGHRLTHDPQTGVYSCNEWDVAAQAYRPRECPAGEESAGTPETVKTFTSDEVMRQLDQARQLQGKEAVPSAPTGPPITSTTMKEVGFVLPAEIRAGEHVSGSVVEDPTLYEGVPGVTVTRVTLPFPPSAQPYSLRGWTVEVSGEPPQAADGPISLKLPPGQVELAILFRLAGNEGAPVSKAIPISFSSHKAKVPKSYQAPAICVKGQLCMVHGIFSGDSRKTFAAFEQRPAKIVAETSDAAYIAIPDRTEPGSRPLAIAEGSKAIVFPTVVAGFNFRPDRRDLNKGQMLLLYANLMGPEELPDAEWRPGNFPPYNLAEAQKLVPGFKPAANDHEAHEKREAEEKREAKEKHTAGKEEHDEAEGGEILLVINNLTPDQVSLRESKNGTYVFQLNSDSFKMGDFMYKFVVEAKVDGNFNVRAHVIPFLAPINGQVFPMTAAPAK